MCNENLRDCKLSIRHILDHFKDKLPLTRYLPDISYVARFSQNDEFCKFRAKVANRRRKTSANILNGDSSPDEDGDGHARSSNPDEGGGPTGHSSGGEGDHGGSGGGITNSQLWQLGSNTNNRSFGENQGGYSSFWKAKKFAQSGHLSGADSLIPDLCALIKARRPRFKILRKLGQGGFGTVDEIQFESTKQTCARKVISFRAKSSSQTSSEASILKELHHSHIIKFLGIHSTQTCLSLFTSPVAESDLAVYLHQASTATNSPGHTVSQPPFRRWLTCLTSAVHYLHNKGLVHGDIKPKNILVYSDQIYLTDFGTARFVMDSPKTDSNPLSGLTPKYYAPEVSLLKSTKYCGDKPTWGRPADIFSLGCVFAEIATVDAGHSLEAFEKFRSSNGSNAPFHAAIAKTHLWIDALNVSSGPRQSFTPQILQTIKCMLSFDPYIRPAARELEEIFEAEFIPDRSFCHDKVHFMFMLDSPKSVDMLAFPHRDSSTSRLESSGHQVFGGQMIALSYPGGVSKVTANVMGDASGMLAKRRIEWLDDEYSPLSNHLQKPASRVATSSGNLLCQEQSQMDDSPHLSACTQHSYNSFILGCSLTRNYQSIPSLKNYLSETRSPSTFAEAFCLWSSILELSSALIALHQSRSSFADQDMEIHVPYAKIKPSNILVERKDGRSPYEWKFVLRDLGLTKLKRKDCSANVDYGLCQPPLSGN